VRKAYVLVIAVIVCVFFSTALGFARPSGDFREADDAKLLVEWGVSREVLARLGEDGSVVASLIRGGLIDQEGVQKLCANFLNPVRFENLEPVIEWPVDPIRHVAITAYGELPLPPDEMSVVSSNQPQRATSVQPLWVNLPDWSGTGPYWKVHSIGGYWKSTAYIDTPTSSDQSLTTSDNPYLYLGIQTPYRDASYMCDAGIAFLRSTGKWALFYNDTTFATQNLSVDAPAGTGLYLIVQVLSTNNQYKLEVIYPPTWQTVGSVTRTVPSTWNFSRTNSSIGVRYVSSIGQKPEDLGSGGYYRNAHWRQVWVYKSGSNSALSSTKTSGIGKYPDEGVVFETVQTEFSDVYVNIECLLP